MQNSSKRSVNRRIALGLALGSVAVAGVAALALTLNSSPVTTPSPGPVASPSPTTRPSRPSGLTPTAESVSPVARPCSSVLPVASFSLGQASGRAVSTHLAGCRFSRFVAVNRCRLASSAPTTQAPQGGRQEQHTRKQRKETEAPTRGTHSQPNADSSHTDGGEDRRGRRSVTRGVPGRPDLRLNGR